MACSRRGRPETPAARRGGKDSAGPGEGRAPAVDDSVARLKGVGSLFSAPSPFAFAPLLLPAGLHGGCERHAPEGSS
jgi:hypothetical protein